MHATVFSPHRYCSFELLICSTIGDTLFRSVLITSYCRCVHSQSILLIILVIVHNYSMYHTVARTLCTQHGIETSQCTGTHVTVSCVQLMSKQGSFHADLCQFRQTGTTVALANRSGLKKLADLQLALKLSTSERTF